jgi:hypothetical protein
MSNMHTLHLRIFSTDLVLIVESDYYDGYHYLWNLYKNLGYDIGECIASSEHENLDNLQDCLRDFCKYVDDEYLRDCEEIKQSIALILNE